MAETRGFYNSAHVLRFNDAVNLIVSNDAERVASIAMAANQCSSRSESLEERRDRGAEQRNSRLDLNALTPRGFHDGAA
jgi:hypothetical protein